METHVGTVWILVLWGIPALIFLIDWLESVLRRRTSSGAAPHPTFAAGFTLRRSDSTLRERHYRKIRPIGRTVEINKYKDDPYEP